MTTQDTNSETLTQAELAHRRNQIVGALRQMAYQSGRYDAIVGRYGFVPTPQMLRMDCADFCRASYDYGHGRGSFEMGVDY